MDVYPIDSETFFLTLLYNGKLGSLSPLHPSLSDDKSKIARSKSCFFIFILCDMEYVVCICEPKVCDRDEKQNFKLDIGVI
jgi:hypothetical protein